MAQFILSAFADEAGDSIDEQILALKENGMVSIEPRNIGGKGILTLTDEELFEVKKKLDENGIFVYSLGSPIGKYPIDEPFDIHLADFERALRASEILGAKNMRIFSFFVKQDELSKYRGEVIARLKTLTELARARGIRLCHENESRIYGQMPSEVADLLDSVPELYGIFDAANYRMNGADIDAGIAATMKRFGYLHIKDAIYKTKTIVPSGEGEGKLKEVLALVDASTDATVTLTLEPHLKLFSAYREIDGHELNGIHEFNTQREAFDFAANALIGILTELGFRKDENNVWKK